MRCSCPKCNAAIDLEIGEIPAEGSFNKCPECGTGYLLRKESFSHRALRSGDAINCAECGSTLGPTLFCQDCHALYPDYYVTETSSAAKKQFGKILARLSALNKIGISKAPKHEHHEHAPAAAPRKTKAGGKGLSQQLTLMAIGLALLVAIGAGGYFYYTNKLETEFSEKYVRAVFMIKTAADTNKKLSAKIVTDWKAAALPQPPRLTAIEQKSLLSASKDVDIIMKELPAKTPQKFAASRDALDKFLEGYKKMQSLNESPSGSADSFADAAAKREDEFRKAGAAMKQGLPEKLATAFAEGKKKYKSLKDM